MAKFKQDSETKVNLMRAFEGESMARNRYSLFASIAQKEGFEQIAQFFLETAENERQHAKIFYNFLDGDDVSLINYPYTTFPSCLAKTFDNLTCAAKSEKEEGDFLYPLFSEVAFKEGFKEVGKTFELISKIELSHMERFSKLASNIENDKVFKRGKNAAWRCMKCGYLEIASTPPDICPVCQHPIAYFELVCECDK